MGTEAGRKCPKCGAVYIWTEAKCPYCGYIHETGAEQKFFRKLEDTRQRLDRVDDAVREDYRDEIRKNSRAIIKRVIIVAAVIAGIAGLFAWSEYRLFHDSRDYSKEMVWEHEHFPELDSLYEEGKYEELDRLLNEYGAEGHDVWDWKYYDEFSNS